MNPTEEAFSIPAVDIQMVRGVYRDTGKGLVGGFLRGLQSDSDGTKSMELWNQVQQFNLSRSMFE